MSEGAKATLWLKRFAPALWVVLGWVGFHLYVNWYWSPLIDSLIHRVLGAWPALAALVSRESNVAGRALGLALKAVVEWSGLVVGLGVLARMVSRARVRSGARDPLEGVRAWVNAQPVWSRVLAGMPGALWLADAIRYFVFRGRFSAAHFLPVLVLFTLALYAVTRAGLRALLAPTLVGPKPESATSLADEITFDAVAVTRETVGAVAAMMAMNVGVIAWLASPHQTGSDWPVMGAFAALAVGGAALFRRASRVAVGVDGVHVSGSSRTRFFAYRDLDLVRVNRGDIELVRGERVMVRLQLHGDDALKRDAVVARIRGAIERVKEGRGAVPAQMVSTATADELVRAAGGAADYRGAALTRDQLWALVEGPEIEAVARRAAALALARTSDGGDRARLRVAAEHCAAPEVRGALARLAEGELLESDAPDEAPLAGARRTA